MLRLSWGYREHNGRIHWKEFFPIADGDQQSPIETKTKEVKYDSSLRPLSIKYDPSSAWWSSHWKLQVTAVSPSLGVCW
uniref:Uncharacterized protein DKFZp469O0425 n=1 Tax=Pongo abelii TaxID=9601 RepID=Q5R8P1_PONAB|nr:hypothetical protein [Pongo abelii]